MPNGHRHWCFTLNNPSDEEIEYIRALATPDGAHSDILRLCAQLERGENGTLHVQGYVGLSTQRSLSVLKRIIGTNRIHADPARGDAASNLAYCTKEDTRITDDERFPEPIIFGEFLRNGQRRGAAGSGGDNLTRTDVVELIRNQPEISSDEIVDQGGLAVLAFNPNIVSTVRSILAVDERRSGVQCHLYIGPPGSGKSRLADHQYPTAFRKPPGTWWDGYSSEQFVILDDFDGNSMSIGDFLRLVDRYPLRVQIKGGFVKMVARYFCITSNLHPSDWWPEQPAARKAAVFRRIGVVVEFFQNQDYALEHPSSSSGASVYFTNAEPGQIDYVAPYPIGLPWVEASADL